MPRNNSIQQDLIVMIQKKAKVIKKVSIFVLLVSFAITAYSQSETALFRSTFYTHFFGAEMQSVDKIQNCTHTVSYYQGKKLDRPRNYELYGRLDRELQGVEFKYSLIEAKPPEGLQLICEYHVHIRNDQKYAALIDTATNDWYEDSTDVLDSLIYGDIIRSSKEPANWVGLYYHASTDKYYFKSDKYCAQVRIRVTSRLKGKHFLRKYNYTIDKEEMYIRLLTSMHFCDDYNVDYDEEMNLNINCYDLYKLDSN